LYPIVIELKIELLYNYPAIERYHNMIQIVEEVQPKEALDQPAKQVFDPLSLNVHAMLFSYGLVDSPESCRKIRCF